MEFQNSQLEYAHENFLKNIKKNPYFVTLNQTIATASQQAAAIHIYFPQLAVRINAYNSASCENLMLTAAAFQLALAIVCCEYISAYSDAFLERFNFSFENSYNFATTKILTIIFCCFAHFGIDFFLTYVILST